MGVNLSQLGDNDLGRKKLKTTSKERKATMKNSYINGIKKLASVNTTALEGLTKRGLKHIQKNPTENVSIRKLKNRESAKNSRMRRKMYIELLEKKICEQQEEIVLGQKMLENNRNPSKDKYSSLGVKSYHSNRQKYLDKLKDALAQNNEGLINTILGEMKVNFFGVKILESFWQQWLRQAVRPEPAFQ